jgi:hypothetical protein
MSTRADAQLFDDGLKLNWLPDELLFSLASRYHLLAHNVLPSQTCRQLFGNPLQGCAHDFPSRIDCFVDRTRGSFGDSEEVIRRHTILPFYLPFQSTAVAASAMSALRGPSIGSLKFQLGLLTSRFRAHHPLKFCMQCMQEDRNQFSVAYWHRAHQLPGVWVCLKHKTPLHESTLKSTGVGRFSWCIPRESYLRPVWQLAAPVDQACLTTLHSLADIVTGVADLPTTIRFEHDRLVAAYRSGLRSLGLIRGVPGRLVLQELAQSYLSFAGPLRFIPELSTLPGTIDEALAQVPRLLRDGLRSTHPLRHATLMTWIFGSWEIAWRSYCAQDIPSDAVAGHADTTAGTCAEDRTDPRRSQFLSMMVDDSWTISGAARALGVDPSTGMAWAAAAGVPTKRRSKVLKPPTLQRLVKMLSRGVDTSKAAIELSISHSTAVKVLRTEVGLHELWRQKRRDQARTAARRKWIEVAKNNPLLGVKAVRTLEPRVYAWLYRNDRIWLDQQVSALAQVPEGNHAKTNWDLRDAELAASIEKVILDLAAERPGRRVSLWRVYQRLPELKAKLSKLDRLPLSKLALERGVRRNADHDVNFTQQLDGMPIGLSR